MHLENAHGVTYVNSIMAYCPDHPTAGNTSLRNYPHMNVPPPNRPRGKTHHLGLEDRGKGRYVIQKSPSPVRGRRDNKKMNRKFPRNRTPEQIRERTRPRGDEHRDRSRRHRRNRTPDRKHRKKNRKNNIPPHSRDRGMTSPQPQTIRRKKNPPPNLHLNSNSPPLNPYQNMMPNSVSPYYHSPNNHHYSINYPNSASPHIVNNKYNLKKTWFVTLA